MSQSDPENTPVLSAEEAKQAAWEARLIAEVEGWRREAGKLGVQNPDDLIPTFRASHELFQYLDRYVFAKRHDSVLANDTECSTEYWVSQYEEGYRAWQGREEFLAKLYTQPSGGSQADPNNKGQ